MGKDETKRTAQIIGTTLFLVVTPVALFFLFRWTWNNDLAWYKDLIYLAIMLPILGFSYVGILAITTAIISAIVDKSVD